MKILALGDVFGEAAADYLVGNLRRIQQENRIDFTVANAENGSGSSGVEPKIAEKLLSAGCDVLTGGNHSMSRSSFFPYLEAHSDCVLRPANYPPDAPGAGYTVIRCAALRVLVVSLRGNCGFDLALDDPFRTLERILEREAGNYDLSVVDGHAEYTSEKLAFFYAFDGRVSVLYGTHTHVPTADLRIGKGGCGYLTDLGMCGPKNSVLGVSPEIIIGRLRDKLPVRFSTANGPIEAMGAIFETDDETGKCKQARRIVF